jgi:hypothetical protein
MLSNTPLLTASVATVGAGIAVYLAWFDYHRRHDSDYRREIRRAERHHERVLRDEAERSQREDRDAIRRIVQAIGREPMPMTTAERQEYMLAQLEEGQRCIDAGVDEKKAASHFYRALIVAQDKGSIATVYDEQLPKSILNILSIMIASAGGLSDLMGGGGGMASPASRMSIHEIPSAGPD